MGRLLLVRDIEMARTALRVPKGPSDAKNTTG